MSQTKQRSGKQKESCRNSHFYSPTNQRGTLVMTKKRSGNARNRHRPTKKRRIVSEEDSSRAVIVIDSDDESEEELLILTWTLGSPHVPLNAERKVLEALSRFGEKERGMLKSQPPKRIRFIQHTCRRHGMHMFQACSLRRHHIQQLNLSKSKAELRLGSDTEIRTSASLFEEVIASHLDKERIPYWDEAAQRKRHRRENPGVCGSQPTPDFLLKTPVCLQVLSSDSERKEARKNGNNCIAKRTIHWIEVKMFYGASTIPQDNKSAVGRILSKMTKYVDLFGEGAVVFMQGCGQELVNELESIGVTALDGFGNNIDLGPVIRHQRTWCADAHGNILP